MIGVERPRSAACRASPGGSDRRPVLEQPGADGALVRVRGLVEAIGAEQLHRPLGVAHPGQRQHLQVADRALSSPSAMAETVRS